MTEPYQKVAGKEGLFIVLHKAKWSPAKAAYLRADRIASIVTGPVCFLQSVVETCGGLSMHSL